MAYYSGGYSSGYESDGAQNYALDHDLRAISFSSGNHVLTSAFNLYGIGTEARALTWIGGGNHAMRLDWNPQATPVTIAFTSGNHSLRKTMGLVATPAALTTASGSHTMTKAMQLEPPQRKITFGSGNHTFQTASGAQEHGLAALAADVALDSGAHGMAVGWAFSHTKALLSFASGTHVLSKGKVTSHTAALITFTGRTATLAPGWALPAEPATAALNSGDHFTTKGVNLYAEPAAVVFATPGDHQMLTVESPELDEWQPAGAPSLGWTMPKTAKQHWRDDHQAERVWGTLPPVSV
jgi:hypothetical protein